MTDWSQSQLLAGLYNDIETLNPEIYPHKRQQFTRLQPTDERSVDTSQIPKKESSKCASMLL